MIPGDHPKFQEIILKHNVHTPGGDVNPDAVCMKQPNAPSNDLRDDNNSNINSARINVHYNRNNTANTADDAVKELCMFAERCELRIDS